MSGLGRPCRRVVSAVRRVGPSGSMSQLTTPLAADSYTGLSVIPPGPAGRSGGGRAGRATFGSFGLPSFSERSVAGGP
jgi:hypothetical protein